MNPRTAIILGASSGIGRALAKIMDREGYTLGLFSRRLNLLESLQGELTHTAHIQTLDIRCAEQTRSAIENMIDTLGGLDVLIISSGIGKLNSALDWEPEADTIATNVMGFCAAANVAMKHFLAVGEGHLVGISSVAALRGGRGAPAYNASKAFISNYMEGLRMKVQRKKRPITISDIKPGFVDTPMAQGMGMFWVAPVERAAEQIFLAIQKRKSHAYITARWRWVAWALKLAPDVLYRRL